MTSWLRSRQVNRAAVKGRKVYMAEAGMAARLGERMADESTLCVLRPLAANWQTCGQYDITPLGAGYGSEASGKRRPLKG
jgi:hypothetical protein